MKISLKNVGSIKGSSIKIGDLTVIAGENDTGKSTFGKVLYSIIKSYNTYASETGRVNNRILMSNFKGLVDIVRAHTREIGSMQLININNSLIKLQQAIVFNKDIGLEVKNLLDSFYMSGNEVAFDFKDKDTDSFVKYRISLERELDKFYHNYRKTRDFKFDEARYCKYAHDILKSEFFGRIVSNKEDSSSISIEFKSATDGNDGFYMTFNNVKNESYKLIGINGFKLRDVTFIDSPAILQYYQSISNIEPENVNSFNMPHHVIDLLSKLKTSKIKNRQSESIKIIDSYDGEMAINDDLTQFFFKRNNEVYPSGNVASGVKAVSIIEMLYEGGEYLR